MPDAPSSAHGRLYDNFSRQASHSHGGSYFDEGFRKPTLEAAHGALYDRFGLPREGSQAHGQHFDDFGWKAMPVLHGPQYDSDFAQPTALTDGGHGTWFDVFRGGTEVRCVVEGADYEGTVIACHPSHAEVRGHDGQVHEVGLSQFLAFRTPTQQQATPSIPESDADAPSAHDSTAHGAFGGQRTPGSTEMPSRVAEAPQGQHRDSGRVEGIPDGLMDTFQALKALAADMDVEKDMTGRPGCSSSGCGAPARVIVKKSASSTPAAFCHPHALAQGPVHSWHEPSNAHHTAWPGKAAAGDAAVAKDVDTTQTGTQGSPAKTVGHRSNCPRGGSAPCGAEVDGACSICGAEVHDHEAVGKTAPIATDNPTGIKVPVREHKATDHHTTGAASRKTCPHCGGELNDYETDLGHPDREHKQGGEGDFNVTAHKCLGSQLEVLKTTLGGS